MSTTKSLTRLRHLMRDTSLFNGKHLEAYIIPSSDSHGSEYLCEKDKRRQFISGFTGSSGIFNSNLFQNKYFMKQYFYF